MLIVVLFCLTYNKTVMADFYPRFVAAAVETSNLVKVKSYQEGVADVVASLQQVLAAWRQAGVQYSVTQPIAILQPLIVRLLRGVASYIHDDCYCRQRYLEGKQPQSLSQSIVVQLPLPYASHSDKFYLEATAALLSMAVDTASEDIKRDAQVLRRVRDALMGMVEVPEIQQSAEQKKALITSSLQPLMMTFMSDVRDFLRNDCNCAERYLFTAEARPVAAAAWPFGGMAVARWR